MQTQAIRNPYISIELEDKNLQKFSCDLQDALEKQGLQCEQASKKVHVSIAYADCDASFDVVSEVASEIACDGFNVKARNFEILEGISTPFDYLVLSIETEGSFQHAVDIVEDHLKTRRFEGGFKSHVSLLRFPKGSLASDFAQSLVRELNASQGAVFALGRCIHLEGESVCIFDPERNCCLQVSCQSQSGQTHRNRSSQTEQSRNLQRRKMAKAA